MDGIHHLAMPSIENNDPRIPMAWRHRDMTLNNPYSRRPDSPSMTSSSSDDREEVPMVRQHYRPLSRHSNIERQEDRIDHYATIRPDQFTGRNGRMEMFQRSNHPSNFFHGQYRNQSNSSSGTLRSTRSVPALALTANLGGTDPCPIHGGKHVPMRRHGSLFDIRSPVLGVPLNLSTIDKKKFHGSKHSLHNGNSNQTFPPSFHPFLETPPYLTPHINPMMRAPHIGMPIDSLHFRDPFNKILTLHHNRSNNYPTKDPTDPYSVEQVCCKGHLIVLWIILGVVTVGVILGIIMGVTIT